MVIGGVLAGLGAVNLEVMMAVVVVCAIVGRLGRVRGGEAGRAPASSSAVPSRGTPAVRRTMAMLEHYGGPAVFLGRFVAFARALIPGLAGMSGLRYRVFLFYNAIGGLIWGVGYTLLGYVVGLSFERILSEVGLWSLAGVALIVVVAVVVRQVLKRRERRRLAVEFADRGMPASVEDRRPDGRRRVGRPGRGRADPVRLSRSGDGSAWCRWPAGCRTRRGWTAGPARCRTRR